MWSLTTSLSLPLIIYISHALNTHEYCTHTHIPFSPTVLFFLIFLHVCTWSSFFLKYPSPIFVWPNAMLSSRFNLYRRIFWHPRSHPSCSSRLGQGSSCLIPLWLRWLLQIAHHSVRWKFLRIGSCLWCWTGSAWQSQHFIITSLSYWAFPKCPALCSVGHMHPLT